MFTIALLIGGWMLIAVVGSGSVFSMSHAPLKALEGRQMEAAFSRVISSGVVDTAWLSTHGFQPLGDVGRSPWNPLRPTVLSPVRTPAVVPRGKMNAGRFLLLCGVNDDSTEFVIQQFISRHHDESNFRQWYSALPMTALTVYRIDRFSEPVYKRIQALSFPENIHEYFAKQTDDTGR